MATGFKLKEQGQALALDNAGQSWQERALTLLAEFCRSSEAKPSFRFEQFRAFAWASGLPNPPSSNAWGAIATAASKRGLICKTGTYQPAQSSKTHGHPVMLWRAAA